MGERGWDPWRQPEKLSALVSQLVTSVALDAAAVLTAVTVTSWFRHMHGPRREVFTIAGASGKNTFHLERPHGYPVAARDEMASISVGEQAGLYG